MVLSINFKQIDDEYDQEYANEYNFGEESENNMKYHWEEGFEIKEVKSYQVNEGGSIKLKRKHNGGLVETEFVNMDVLECICEDGEVVSFGVSKSALRNIHKMKRKDKVYYYYYIKDKIQLKKIINGVYVSTNELPQNI